MTLLQALSGTNPKCPICDDLICFSMNLDGKFHGSYVQLSILPETELKYPIVFGAPNSSYTMSITEEDCLFTANRHISRIIIYGSCKSGEYKVYFCDAWFPVVKDNECIYLNRYLHNPFEEIHIGEYKIRNLLSDNKTIVYKHRQHKSSNGGEFSTAIELFETSLLSASTWKVKDIKEKINKLQLLI